MASDEPVMPMVSAFRRCFAGRPDLIVNPQRAERGGHHAVRGAHHQRRAEIVNEQVEEGDQHVQHQKAFRKGAQAVLLAEFHQQQVDGDVGHHINRGQPGDFG